MSAYTFGDVLRFNDLPRNRLKRWVAAGIITPAVPAESGGTQRRFSFRNLVEARACDELRGLGMNEALMRVVVQSLNAIWNQPEDPINSRRPDAPTHRDMTVLWLAFQRHEIPDFDHPDLPPELTESVATYPVDNADLVSRLTTGEADGSGIAESGIALPIARMIRDLEERTGDRFDLTPAPAAAAPARTDLEQETDQATESIALKIATALRAALEAQSLSDDQQKAIATAFLAALKPTKDET